MHTLYIFYDQHCGLCSSFRRWLESQPAYVRFAFIAYDTEQARQLLPDIATRRADEEILVLGNDGSLWQGGSAWITCLWALVSYRGWAITLANTLPAERLKRVVQWISQRRIQISQLLRLRPDQILRQSALVDCENGSCKRPAAYTATH
jgi:predicted DCC family thiol-disulfide oxidoreductase YuxK